MTDLLQAILLSFGFGVALGAIIQALVVSRIVRKARKINDQVSGRSALNYLFSRL